MSGLVTSIRRVTSSLPNLSSGTSTFSPVSYTHLLYELRAKQPLFRDISFDTIAAYADHAAIVHYEPTPLSDVKLEPKGLLLLDSGAQYSDGTTDITRTIALGDVSDRERHVYTLVLKGHLALQNLCFPRSASGTQLDAVARTAMWREGMNFMHGTGHGVGSYLSVHEGPHQIRQEYRGAPMVEGMTVTDEPGLYLDGRFGVRIENTDAFLVVFDVAVACAGDLAAGDFGEYFLGFDELVDGDVVFFAVRNGPFVFGGAKVRHAYGQAGGESFEEGG